MQLQQQQQLARGAAAAAPRLGTLPPPLSALPLYSGGGRGYGATAAATAVSPCPRGRTHACSLSPSSSSSTEPSTVAATTAGVTSPPAPPVPGDAPRAAATFGSKRRGTATPLRAARRGVAAAAAARALQPPVAEYKNTPFGQWPTEGEMGLAWHDAATAPYVDLIVAGAGPAGVSLAQRVASQGFRVCVVDPDPLAVWVNNYGVWLDEFQEFGLEDCLHMVWPKAQVWLDEGEEGIK
eukprot:365387-Chlamydomonas_euryale.AAC.12